MVETLFGTPPAINSPDNAEDTYTMSTRVTFAVAGNITGIRFWGATNNITTAPFVAVYSTAGVLQTSEAMVGPFAPAAWNTRMLATPFSVGAGSTFDVAVGPRDRYAANTATFPNSSGNLSGVAGRFIPSAVLAFPNSANQTTWYGIDLLFEVASTGAPAGNAPGTGVANAAAAAVSPSAGVSTGTGSAPSATINAAPSAQVASGVGAALQPSITLEGEVHVYKFGPCEPWEPIWNCNISAIVGAPAVTGNAVQAASEILYQLTAQRFGLCNVKLRPCRQSCYGNFPWWEWWQYGTYPQPYWWNGTWYNLACNSCPSNSCSCVGLDETLLPGPVVEITEVKLDGVVLTKNVDYRIDDYRKLVRLNGVLWPFCQNMNLADTEVGTWSVTANYGEIVPVLGRMAVGELATEIVKFLVCDNTCALPQGVVDVSRQGVSMTIANISELFKTGFIQLRMCDLFIKTANPNHLQARAAVYDLDSPDFRAWGTS